MIKTRIEAVSCYVPHRKVTNALLEEEINTKRIWLAPGLLGKVFGVADRYVADSSEQASDLAVEAARDIIRKYGTASIDCLIFAAASSDLIEPATANIVQAKLGLDCPVMDVKNACNSFVTALQVASALIESRQYQRILICTGEKPSDSVKKEFESLQDFRLSVSAFTLGDAGTAVLVVMSDDDSHIVFQKFTSVGEHWNLCMIQGGGSMYPHDGTMNFFTGQTSELRSAIIKRARSFISACFIEAEIRASDIDHLFTHQVSMDIFNDVIEITEVPREKCHITFNQFGNTAAASIPLAIYEAERSKVLKKGDVVLLIGMAAGISISFQLIIW